MYWHKILYKEMNDNYNYKSWRNISLLHITRRRDEFEMRLEPIAKSLLSVEE